MRFDFALDRLQQADSNIITFFGSSSRIDGHHDDASNDRTMQLIEHTFAWIMPSIAPLKLLPVVECVHEGTSANMSHAIRALK